MSDPMTPVPPAAVQPMPTPKRHWTGIAITLLVIGLLIAIPSGLCTGLFGVVAIYDMLTSPSSEGFGTLVGALVTGGVPLAFGVVLVLVAFAVRK